ncbi:MAG: EVE domain-containing protein [Nevskiales bacterium]
MNYWLLKSEPDEFGIDHLAARAKQTEMWDGVRNYTARNHMRAMRKGDQAFFYHSSCVVPGIAGVIEIVREAYPDPRQFERNSDYFDAASLADNPRWSAVDVKFLRKLQRVITLEELRAQAPKLGEFVLLRRGRLSVLPVTAAQWKFVFTLE